MARKKAEDVESDIFYLPIEAPEVTIPIRVRVNWFLVNGVEDVSSNGISSLVSEDFNFSGLFTYTIFDKRPSPQTDGLLYDAVMSGRVHDYKVRYRALPAWNWFAWMAFFSHGRLPPFVDITESEGTLKISASLLGIRNGRTYGPYTGQALLTRKTKWPEFSDRMDWFKPKLGAVQNASLMQTAVASLRDNIARDRIVLLELSDWR